jgi:hypothetical protein
MDLAGDEVDAGQQADRAVALIFMLPCEARVDARLGRQIRGGRRDRLATQLLVVRDDRHRVARPPFACLAVPRRRVLKDRCLSKLDTRNSDQARGIPLGCWGLGPRRVAPEEQRGGGRAIPFVASAAPGGLTVAGANGAACPGRGPACVFGAGWSAARRKTRQRARYVSGALTQERIAATCNSADTVGLLDCPMWQGDR